MMMNLHVNSETGRLHAVVLGLPTSPGPAPALKDTFDSKSYESVLHGVYPSEEDMVREMGAFFPCASSTKRMMRASVVSCPVRVTRI